MQYHLSVRAARGLVLGLAVTACGGFEAAERGPSTGFSDSPSRLRDASRVVEVVTTAGAGGLTQVSSLAVDSRGLIYVPDPYQHRVVVFGADGQVVRSFGRRGAGPNEFRALRGLQVLPGDSVLVYDPVLGRVTVFPPDGDTAAYTVNLAASVPGSAPFEVRRTNSGGGYVALFRPQFAFQSGAAVGPRTERIHLLGPDGAPGRTLIEFPAKSFLVAETSVMPNPFGHEGFARLDSGDRLHFVWSDTVGVVTYDLSGARLGTFAAPFTPPAITRDDVRETMAGVTEWIRPRFEAVLADSLPPRWPAVRQVLVDDRDRLWMALGGSRSRPTEWAAFSPEGSYLGSVLVPAGNDVRLIRGDGFLYAERVDENDIPSVVVYQMVRPIR